MLAGALLLSGCAEPPATADKPAPPPEVPAAPAVKSDASPAASPTASPAAPLRVNVFLEYSGGMKGFVPVGNAGRPATEFQRRVLSLLTETSVSGAAGTPRYFLVYKDTLLRPTTFDQMRDVVLGLRADAALGTELPDMLQGILNRPQAGSEVSVIVSDFIYGPAQKSKIPLIADYIRTAVDAVRQKKLAVAVLAERSAFYGTYFPAVKTPVPRRQLRGERVPYYAWVVGPPDQVSRYLAAVVKNPPAEQAYYGLTFRSIPAGAVLTGLPAGSPLLPGGGGSVMQATLNSATALDIEDVKSGVEFTVGLNLSQLPEAWRQPALLARQLRVSLAGAAPLLVPGSVQRLTAAEQAATPALAAYTHRLRLRLTSLPAGPSRLTLTLAAPETPAWAAAWSTDNDNQPGPVANTYRLTDVLRGLRGAFPDTLPPAFSVEFAVSNQD